MAILPQERRSVAWSDCGLVQIDLPAHDVPDPSTDNFLLCLVRRGEADSSIRFGERWWHGRLGPGMFAPVTPPDVTGEIRLGAPQRHLIVTIPAARVAAILAHGDVDLGRLHERSFRDPLLAQICLSLWDHAASAQPRDRLFEDHGLAALVSGLSRRSEKLAPRPRSARPLSDTEWIRVATYIGDQLDTELKLEALAQLVGMSQYAFLRSFAARSGCPPHRYVLRRRVEHARSLLMDPRLALSDIALRAGFADQAHMTSTFSRLIADTPGRLRRRAFSAAGDPGGTREPAGRGDDICRSRAISSKTPPT